ncbi:Bug family tripartite tricarboxylate transporter substrate binding protein [Geoalkalibacter halelectricus]|uniref:Bug family tripartite tricarboxylate transporter substrate binding protein n=1 Tax=Geoalkalibacter halelectricus TaxID=2847045 RepID=UPI003D2300F9
MNRFAKIAMTLPVMCAAFILAGATSYIAPLGASEPFYKGKTVNIVVRSGPGGGNDFYARLLARHIGRHLTGNPDTVVTNMPGGGGLVAANHIYHRARKDGTEFGLLSRDVASVQRLGATGVRYDARNFAVLGNMGSDTYIWVVRNEFPIKDMNDLRHFNGIVRFGGTGAGTASVQSIRLFKADGLPVEVIFGFDGTAERIVALIRGDIDGTSGSYGSLLPSIRQENLRVIGRFGSDPELAHVPNARMIITPERRALAALMAAPLEMSRPLLSGPGTPEERVAELRTAIKDALHDPRLLDEAKRADRDIGWTSAEEVEELMAEILSASDQIVADFRAL